MSDSEELSQDERPSINSEVASDEIQVDAVSVKSATKINEHDEPKSTQLSASKEEEATEEIDWKNVNKSSDSEHTLPPGDICRICHMGGFPPLTRGNSFWDWSLPNSNLEQTSNTTSCFAFLGPLISACKCRGTVGLIHAECLERWLTESGHTRCELCGHKYATKRVPRHTVGRSIAIGLSTVLATRQVFLDILYLIAMTPFAVFSCYICGSAMKIMFDNRMKEIPWSIVTMLPTCCLILFAYWGWLLTVSRLHGRRWHRYWRNNFVIRLDTDNSGALHRTRNDDFQSTLSV